MQERNAHHPGMTRTRYRLYLESSFWNRLADDVSDPRRGLTYAFLNFVRGRHELVISRVVTAEIAAMPNPDVHRIVRRQMRKARPRFLTNEREAEALAIELLRQMRRNRAGHMDMLHLGFAILGAADALVTWDIRDLARPLTRDAAGRVSRHRGLRAPLIGTPEEIARWLNLAIGWTGNSGKRKPGFHGGP